MKTLKRQTPGASSLVLFFSGWSAPAELFARLEADAGTDVMICHDYRDMTFDGDLSHYKEVHLIAWSMGVRMAELALGGKQTFATATAVNGTPCPIDDAYGIPKSIFLGTLEGLTAESLTRFNRRMCGSREVLAQYSAAAARPFEEVRDELRAIYDRCMLPSDKSIRWTRAVVGSDDRIFPAANQRAFWDGRCEVSTISAPHYPFHLWTRWREL